MTQPMGRRSRRRASELYGLYRKKVLKASSRLARQYGRWIDPHTPEDIAQQAWLKILRYYDHPLYGYREDQSSMARWLHNIVTTVGIGLMRERLRAKRGGPAITIVPIHPTGHVGRLKRDQSTADWDGEVHKSSERDQPLEPRDHHRATDARVQISQLLAHSKMPRATRAVLEQWLIYHDFTLMERELTKQWLPIYKSLDGSDTPTRRALDRWFGRDRSKRITYLKNRHSAAVQFLRQTALNLDQRGRDQWIETAGIDVLDGLNAWIITMLGRKGITTLHQLTLMTERQIMEVNGLGPRALLEVKEALGALGLGLARRRHA